GSVAVDRHAAENAHVGPGRAREEPEGSGAGVAAEPFSERRAASKGRSARPVDEALCEGGGPRFRGALPAAGSPGVPLLLASHGGPAGSRRLLPGNPAPDPSRARDLPGWRRYAALGVRDLSLGLSRSTAVSSSPARGAGVGERRGRRGEAAQRRSLLSGGGSPSP